MTEDHAPVALPDPLAPAEDEWGAMTRSGLFKVLMGGGAGAAALTLLSSPAAFAATRRSIAPGNKTDVTILQYALTLEYLGASFYDSALQNAHLSGDAHEVALAFRGHERAHVKFVQATLTKLGAKPHAEQKFDFGSATKSKTAFLKTSALIEEMCVETLNGAGPLVTKPVLIGASELVSVEARQASWVRAILGENAAPFAFNPAYTAAQSMAAVKKLGFVEELVMSGLSIEEVDVDGAIRETADAVSGDTRAGFMTKAALGAGGLIGGGALLATLPGVASATSANDVAILNFALTLEYLEAKFYGTAISLGTVGKGPEREFAMTAYKHETEHVAFLKKALGSAAIKEPTFDFGMATGKDLFVKTAITLEDTGVRAYKGQAPLIQSTDVLKAALSIHSVEANHAAWIRYIANEIPTYTGAFELPLTKAQVLAAVSATGFIQS